MTSVASVARSRVKQACVAACMVLALTGCGWFTGPSRPLWIDGGSVQFPPAQYLLGVGQADSRSQATEQAYAAVSKIFKAEITAQAKDWESYLVVETRGRTSTEHRLTLDNVTRVTTDKVLENVQILDTWFDRKTRQYYALAGMNRAQAESAMVERLGDLDRTIQTEVTEAHQTADKLTHVRNLKRAAKNLVLREAYNTDLRIIRSSGQGNPAAYRVAELTTELEQFLATNLGMAVEMSGDQADPVERALIDGLTREGFSVVGRGSASGAVPVELLIKGMVRLWPIEVHDPQFRYVRWCTDAVIEEVSIHRVIGAVSKGGREGHVTEREAAAKAVRVMQQEFASDLARSVAAHVYGETDLPVSDSLPSGCPREAAQPQSNR
ncbi:MAG: LPP20 family lipoprotein [Nitrospira defluvii]|nr:LPP20 family lipoprotein [Nitrospira defluvii]